MKQTPRNFGTILADPHTTAAVSTVVVIHSLTAVSPRTQRAATVVEEKFTMDLQFFLHQPQRQLQQRQQPSLLLTVAKILLSRLIFSLITTPQRLPGPSPTLVMARR